MYNLSTDIAQEIRTVVTVFNDFNNILYVIDRHFQDSLPYPI
jgi:hypothetical protein